MALTQPSRAAVPFPVHKALSLLDGVATNGGAAPAGSTTMLASNQVAVPPAIEHSALNLMTTRVLTPAGVRKANSHWAPAAGLRSSATAGGTPPAGHTDWANCGLVLAAAPMTCAQAEPDMRPTAQTTAKDRKSVV